MDSQQTTAYLRRIGAERPSRPDAAALRDLQLHHLLAVPFENLSLHLGEEVGLDEDALVAKVVERHRGGFCYELNGAFAALLRALGFGVSLFQARVHGDGGRLGIPYDHLALGVETDDGTGPWLADVGFGDHSHYPLALGRDGDQEDPAGVFRVAAVPGGGPPDDLDLFHNGRPVFRLDQRPRALEDFEAGAWWHRTSPKSHFTRSVVCSRLTPEGRISLAGRTLITTVGTERTKTPLPTDTAVLEAYREYFGIELSTVPAVGGTAAELRIRQP